MVERRELLRIWSRRIWRRPWLCLGVTCAICAVGWIGVGLLTARQTAAAPGVLFALVLLAGVAAGALAAALVAGRAPVSDSAAQLQRSFGRPVLGSVADLAPGSWRRATPHPPFALACLALISMFAGLLVARAPGWRLSRDPPC